MKIALVVGTYNGKDIIVKCVESLLKTNYKNKEIIVVDDGSTDSTQEVLKPYSGRIKILKKERGGVASARNFAANRTNAELIATTDSDCEVTPEWISSAVSHFKSPEIGAVTGEKKYKITNIVSAVRSAEYSVRFSNRSQEANSIECPCAIIKRDVWISIGGFNEGTKVGGEDTEFGYRLIKKGFKIIYDKNVIVYHDPEESLKMYMKRNYRNGVAYIRNFLWNRKESMEDDFFPLSLKMQPIFNLLFLISLGMGLILLNPFILIVSVTLLLLISILFGPIIKDVVKVKGIRSIPLSLIILHLRNNIWSFSFFVGLMKYWRL